MVRDGEVVGRGFHTYAGLHHAEIIALAQAGEKARGATLYLNLEPCSHQGRTPPCVDALIAGRRGAGGRARRQIRTRWSPDRASPGCARPASKWRWPSEFAAEAEKLNEPFLHFMRTGRPLVTLKTAITLDGKISAPDDNRGWITSERARAHVQELRHDHDAILTGIGTVLADDCLLTRPHRPAALPPAAAHRDGFAAPPAARFQNGAQRRRRRAGRDHLAPPPPNAASCSKRRGIQVLVFDGPGGRADLRSVVDWLGRQRYLSLMIEAGSKLNWTALESGVVDRIFFYYGPKILGGLEALPLAGGIGRRRRVGRHPHARHHHSPDSAGRVRRGRIPGCSPGSLRNWARSRGRRRAPLGALLAPS